MADSFNTPTSKLKEESGELKSSESKLSVQKTPTATKIEEFFASVEKTLHKSFQDKEYRRGRRHDKNFWNQRKREVLEGLKEIKLCDVEFKSGTP
ncbi:hypothetical protein OSB04_013262 [Centaurea solstitialis]|uniref:Uncharacterized protein n=1 Tax=Centaurea solstitialis TaxID=347529 RepID=A0AA38TKG9_9ASTR|nr:hypothetical protein OSB04_013262 [Centaurea solstitialis]